MHRPLQRLCHFIFYSCLLAAASFSVSAEEIILAVATNFNHAIKPIAQQFEQQTGHKVTLVFGATGKHYAQIVHGAPFDAFFAADRARPELLEKKNHIVANSRFTYALGRLALWSGNAELLDKNTDVAISVLQKAEFKHLAIAHPKLAPYGQAAVEALDSLQLFDSLKGKLIYGENIGQTFQFVHSRAAELGFVAYSQVIALQTSKVTSAGSYWLPPSSFYQLIEQQAVILKDRPVSHEFFKFVQSAEVRHIIRTHGYAIPEP